MLSTRKSLAWSFSQEFFQKGTTFIGTIFVARLLTPGEVGVFSIAMAANFFISTFRSFGIGNYLIREPELTNDKIRTAFGMSILIQWTLGFFLYLIRPYLAALYNEPGISDVLFLITLTFFIAPIGQPASALLQREMRFDVLHHVSVIASMIGTVTTVTLAFQGWSYMALAWGALTGQAVRAVLLLVVRPDHLGLRPGFVHFRDILNFGSWMTASGVAMTVATEGTKFVLGGFLTPASLALYERAHQLPYHARQALFKPVGRVLIPSFSKDIRAGVSIAPSVETYIAALTAVLWPMCLIMGFLATPIVLLLFGENWRVAGNLLPYLLAGMAIRSCLPTPNEILIPYGLVRRLTALRVAQAVFTLSLAALGALHSLELFAQLQVLNAGIFIAMNAVAIGSLIGVPAADMLRVYARSLSITVAAALPAFGTYAVFGTDVPLLWLLGTVAVCPLLWLFAVHVTAHPLKDEIMRSTNWLLRRNRQVPGRF